MRRPVLRQTEREVSRLRGQIGETEARIASARSQLTETEFKIAETKKSGQSDILTQLQSVVEKIAQAEQERAASQRPISALRDQGAADGLRQRTHRTHSRRGDRPRADRNVHHPQGRPASGHGEGKPRRGRRSPSRSARDRAAELAEASHSARTRGHGRQRFPGPAEGRAHRPGLFQGEDRYSGRTRRRSCRARSCSRACPPRF